MRIYSLYLIGNGNRVAEVRVLNVADDEAAIDKAASAFDGRPMELWEGPRKIKAFRTPADSATASAT